jgi:hypothetical protein
VINYLRCTRSSRSNLLNRVKNKGLKLSSRLCRRKRKSHRVSNLEGVTIGLLLTGITVKVANESHRGRSGIVATVVTALERVEQDHLGLGADD